MSLLDARDIAVTYARDGRPVLALKPTSVTVAPGEAVGVIGESGSGKSTLARAIVGLEPLSEGQIELDGRSVAVAGVRRRPDLDFARTVQFVFQDAAGALNPRMLNWQAATEPAALLGGTTRGNARRYLAGRLFAQVNLPATSLDHYPHALSGGQRQRLALCRALSVSPRLMILDEPTSALDVSVQAVILDQLLSLNQDGMALLLISHDLGVIRHLCTRVIVMRDGAIVEAASRETLFSSPSHPYTRALLAAAGFPTPETPLHLN